VPHAIAVLNTYVGVLTSGVSKLDFNVSVQKKPKFQYFGVIFSTKPQPQTSPATMMMLTNIIMIYIAEYL